jgi:fatty-acyl-CoA synthase
MGIFANLKREVSLLGDLTRTQKLVKPLTPDSTTIIADDFEAVVDRDPAKAAIVFEGTTWTYGQFDAYANRVANWALRQGYGPGDSVAIFMSNCPDYVAIWVGLAKAGVAAALLNSNLQGAGLAHCISVAGAKAMIAGADLSEQVATLTAAQREGVGVWSHGGPMNGAQDLDSALAEESAARPAKSVRAGITGKDIAMYVYTSGTTGLPKAARMTNSRIQGMLRAFHGGLNTKASDRVYVALPLYHGTGGLCGVGAAMIPGGTLLLRRKFSASQFWDDVADQKASIFVYIGELCRYLINQPEHPKERAHNLRGAFGNGLRPEVWERFQPRFAIPKILEFYGSTEGNVSLLNFEGRVGAIGRIPKYLEKSFNIKIVKFDVENETPVRGPDGLCIEAGPDEAGEAVGKISEDPRFRFEGYTGDTKQTEKKILRDVFEKGDVYFRTGDLLKKDAEGYYYFIDRIGDTFRWKGENVSTNEVAEAFATFEGVKEANVFGVEVPGSEGRAGMVALVADPGIDFAALHRHVATNLPTYARPLFLRLMPESDITGTFKFRKVDLMKEGFDPSKISVPMKFADPVAGGYVDLTPEVYARICGGAFKF